MLLQLPREHLVIRFLSGVKAPVLQDGDLTVSQVTHDLSRSRTNAVVGEEHFTGG